MAGDARREQSRAGLGLSIPDAIEEGVSVWLSGANVDATDYVALLANAAAALGINARYFRDPHPTSTVTGAARYVRLDRDASGPVHARDGPLTHPKLEVAYQVSRWDDRIGVGADLAELQEELDRVLHAVLVDAGIDPAPEENNGDPGGPGPYFKDSYFTPEVGDHRETPSLNLSRIQHEQESVVIRHIADGLSPVEWESIQALVTDSGSVSPADIAEDHGRNVGSVRRALRRMEDLVERSYGEVAMRSSYVAELLHEKVRETREATR